MTSTDITRRDESLTTLSVAEMQDVSLVLAQSGFFNDKRTQAQVFVAVLAGQELGVPPFAAVKGIHIIQGRPEIGAELLASLVKQSTRYDFRVTHLDTQSCTVAFYEHGEQVGESTFTIDDAKTAGLLSNATWQKYPRNMLYARAISNGVSWFCPDVTRGRVYTDGEAPIDQTPSMAERFATADVVDVEEAPSRAALPAPAGETAGAAAPTSGKASEPPASAAPAEPIPTPNAEPLSWFKLVTALTTEERKALYDILVSEEAAPARRSTRALADVLEQMPQARAAALVGRAERRIRAAGVSSSNADATPNPTTTAAEGGDGVAGADKAASPAPSGTDTPAPTDDPFNLVQPDVSGGDAEAFQRHLDEDTDEKAMNEARQAAAAKGTPEGGQTVIS